MVTGTIDQLTARERDCLRLVARGMSSKEIALTLGLSPLTVDGYLKEAARTLGVSSRREAARILAAHEHLSPQAPEKPPKIWGPSRWTLPKRCIPRFHCLRNGPKPNRVFGSRF